jgi:poly(3-hydroxybutyrate) depolymerase
MLYEIHEWQRVAFGPWNYFAKASHELLTNPFSLLSHLPASRRYAANAELVSRLTQDFPKPEFGLEHTVVAGQPVKVTEVIAIEKSFCNLLHFRRALPRGHKPDPKVLLVAPLSGHHATLLRDTVRALMPDHEVYITDWLDARMVPLSEGPFHFDDYVEYVKQFIRFLGPDMHVISVCQPTVPVLAAVSLLATEDDPVKPRSMVMMGGPIDARSSPTAVNSLATQKPYSWFERHLIERVPLKYPGYMRRVYPGFMQHMGFMAMNPTRHADAHRDFYNHLVAGDDESAAAHRKFYDEYNAVLDMPAEYYLETVRRVFQEFHLPKGRMFVNEQLVRPQDIRNTALLTIEGELDDISGNGQTRAAQDLCKNIPAGKKEHYEVPGAGHYGIFSGRRWREVVYPRVRTFIRKHARASLARVSA